MYVALLSSEDADRGWGSICVCTLECTGARRELAVRTHVGLKLSGPIHLSVLWEIRLGEKCWFLHAYTEKEKTCGIKRQGDIMRQREETEKSSELDSLLCFVIIFISWCESKRSR